MIPSSSSFLVVVHVGFRRPKPKAEKEKPGEWTSIEGIF